MIATVKLSDGRRVNLNLVCYTQGPMGNDRIGYVTFAAMNNEEWMQERVSGEDLELVNAALDQYAVKIPETTTPILPQEEFLRLRNDIARGHCGVSLCEGCCAKIDKLTDSHAAALAEIESLEKEKSECTKNSTPN